MCTEHAESADYSPEDRESRQREAVEIRELEREEVIDMGTSMRHASKLIDTAKMQLSFMYFLCCAW